MRDLRPQPAGSATPPPRPPSSGWVKLGTGLAVIGAEITESVLHPAAAVPLEITDAAIPVISGLILLTTIVFGSAETVERVFRLLRWIRNRPEPAAPDSPGPSAGNDLMAQQAATVHEFDVSPSRRRRHGSGRWRHPARPAAPAEPGRGPRPPGPSSAAGEPPS
jgi:hypothetical protein